MTKTYHVLNGDALKEQFPASISGDRIIMRECLVDGDVSGDTMESFFANRAVYLNKTYGEVEDGYYERESIPELTKIIDIPDGAEINLYFEDDLFCQVNFWFVCWLLKEKKDTTVYLIRPEEHTMYGFGGLNQDLLIEALGNRTQLTEVNLLADLWINYRSDDRDQLLENSTKLQKLPFVRNAVEAHLERFPKEGLGRPEKTLNAIMDELGTDKFGPVFQEFCKRESVYGFGDLQVKKLFDELMQNR